MSDIDLKELLAYIDPSILQYQEWLNVGMALKHEGYTASDWESWSKRDPGRYREGECFRKWNSFFGSSQPITGGTIIAMAKEQGWRPDYSDRDVGHALEWDSTIGGKEGAYIDPTWVEGQEVEEPDDWDPVKDIITYLETLFEASENVGYVTESWQKDDKYLPTKGHWDRSAGELIEQLNKSNGDLTNVFGDWKEAAGAWIRFNPLDGNGCKNENVTDYRYALVESDAMDIDKQHAILRELELPIACLVHSGNKSLHAITRIDAATYEEYRKRVDYLYALCAKNGLVVDTQNKNPSRLSRMPGVTRNGQKQFLIATNIGKASWAEWFEWIEGINDDLPDIEDLASVWDNLPELAPSLINGMLRQGHKMLLAGPSKAGKSFALIELCCAIAEGRTWLGWDCAKGQVLYVNLELDRASALHRFRDVYEALGWDPVSIGNIDIWNLRGKAVAMDKLAPKLIRRAQKKQYIAVIIDPIYKVITGDENSADQMAHFTNQFDKICTELGTAVIYCHHHSKGYQGQKRSMDRASGSGVFARDPDALLDLTELVLTENLIKQEVIKATCKAIIEILRKYHPDYLDIDVSQDDALSEAAMRRHAENVLTKDQLQELYEQLRDAREAATRKTAWRIEGTLREYPKFEPLNIWFDYPVHNPDETGVLKDMDPEFEMAPWKKAAEKRKDPAVKKEARQNALEIAFASLEMDNEDNPITTQDLAEEMGITTRTVRNRINEHGGFEIERQGNGQPGIVRRKNQRGKEHE